MKCPPSDCVHTATHCAIDCWLSTLSTLFLLPTAASFMVCSNWLLHSGLPPWYKINPVGPNWVTEHAMPVLSIFLHSQKFSSLWWNVEVLWYDVATFTLMLQGVHPLNTVVIRFPEYSCNMELQNIPWYHVVLWGYCLIFLSTYELKSVSKVILCYLAWIFLCLRVWIPYVGNTILGKLSLITGQYMRQNS